MEQINHIGFVMVVIELKDFALWPSGMDFHDPRLEGYGMTVIKNQYS